MSLYQEAKANPFGFRDVLPEQVHAHGGESSIHLVDVREPHEFTGELGHINGAELVPLATVPEKAKSWSKQDIYVLICRSGGRSGRAAQVLHQMGFPQVMNMIGGMIAFNEKKLPVVR